MLFLVDNSGSVISTEISLAMDFIMAIVNNYASNIGLDAIMVAITTFGQGSQTLLGLNEGISVNIVNSSIESIPFSLGPTNVETGLIEAAAALVNSTSVTSVVIVTEGPLSGPAPNVMAISDLQDIADVIVIGIDTQGQHQMTVRSLSSPNQTEGINYFLLPAFNSLQTIVDDVIAQLDAHCLSI